MKVREVPAGKTLYRGSWNNTLRANAPVWFANMKNNANIYGPVTEYKTTKKLRLVDMGDLPTVVALFNKSRSENVRKHIRSAFLYNRSKKTTNAMTNRGPHVAVRSSKIKHDIHVAQFICRMGYDGYYAPALEGRGKMFHSEYALCAPSKSLVRVKRHAPTQPPPITPKLGVSNRLVNEISRANYGLL